jgi:beta-glucosidase
VYVERDMKELKGFSRVALKAGERKAVTIHVRRADLCRWDEAAQTWVPGKGDMTVHVGGSSVNLPLTLKTKL